MVMSMVNRTQANLLTYGLSQNAMLQAVDVSSSWPERLSMNVIYQGEKVHIQSRLIGSFWVTSILAAIGGALAAGLSLQACADVIAKTEPFVDRMYEVVSDDGVTFIRDDAKSPYWSIPAVLEVVKQARAKRKIIVFGNLSDYPGSGSRKYRKVARDALAVADKVILVGKFSTSVAKLKESLGAGRIMGFETLYEANQFLQPYMQEGDLILLKGSYKVDHLHRIEMDRTSEIACWRQKCGRINPCYRCPRQLQVFIPVDTFGVRKLEE
jgi:UDP-N-acetylmuramoyl-tripeptide--D-alanyl-D-alanine ligase